MISNESIEWLWSCKREIETGNKILNDMAEITAREEERNGRISKTEPTLKDAFGRRQHLQLGIPCGENGHRLLDVSPRLAETIIRAHIAKKEAELVEAEERARLELSMEK